MSQLLIRPPSSSTGTPAWILPAALLVAGDAVFLLFDPQLPLLIAGGAAALAASGASNTSCQSPSTSARRFAAPVLLLGGPNGALTGALCRSSALATTAAPAPACACNAAANYIGPRFAGAVNHKKQRVFVIVVFTVPVCGTCRSGGEHGGAAAAEAAAGAGSRGGDRAAAAAGPAQHAP